MTYTKEQLYKQTVLATCWYKDVDYDEDLHIVHLADKDGHVLITIYSHDNWIEIEIVSGDCIEISCEHMYKKGIVKRLQSFINNILYGECCFTFIDDNNEIVIDHC